ncbi:hypothetical protein ACFWP3_12310 [Streptomyces sp. NPDC058525]|uniref:hypothetical protein n=1 Tax=unclassified Streptomyces TaxID=2593676 RepID=UPI003651C24B
MFTNSWQRPLILAATTFALVTGTAVAAQASVHHTPAGVTTAVVADLPTTCVGGGEGGKGGKGGEGGKGGQPGQPGEPGKPGSVGCLLGFEDLPDKKKSDLTVVDKVRIVLTLLADDSDETKEKISKKYDIPEEQLDTWKRQYVDGDWFALMGDSLA